MSDSASSAGWDTSHRYLLDTLEALALDADGQIARVGGPYVAWEMRQDAVDFAEAVLSEPERINPAADGLRTLVLMLKALPPAAIDGPNDDALAHPGWVDVRALARSLLQTMRQRENAKRHDWPVRKVHIYAAGAAVFGFAQHFIKPVVPGWVLLLTAIAYCVALRWISEKCGRP